MSVLDISKGSRIFSRPSLVPAVGGRDETSPNRGQEPFTFWLLNAMRRPTTRAVSDGNVGPPGEPLNVQRLDVLPVRRSVSGDLVAT